MKLHSLYSLLNGVISTGTEMKKTWKLRFVQRWNAAHIVAPVHSVYHDAIQVHVPDDGDEDGDGAVEDCYVAPSSCLQEQEEVFLLRINFMR